MSADIIPGIIALLICLYLLYLQYLQYEANKNVVTVSNGSTAISNPASLTFSNPINTAISGCSLTEAVMYEDNGTMCRTWLKISVVPGLTNLTTSVSFTLPQKTSNFTTAAPLIAAGQPLVMYNGNICGQTSVVSVPGTTTATLTFTSSGTTSHVMDCMLAYNI